MELEHAQIIASEIIDRLEPCCERLSVAGSIRRRRPLVHDIDLVCIPSNQGQFIYELQQMGKMKVGGGKLIRVDLSDHFTGL